MLKAYRYYHTLTPFANNTKLLPGGSEYSAARPTAEVYDSATNMSTSRYAHTATLLRNEQILITGERNTSGTSISSAELHTSSSKSFINTGSMRIPRTYFTSTLLSDGSIVLVTAGWISANETVPTTKLLVRGSWILTANNNMASSRAYHAGVLLSSGGGLADCEKYFL